MVVNDSILVPNSSKTFVCEKCYFNCSRLSQYTRHLARRKHIMDSKIYDTCYNDMKTKYNNYKIMENF